MRLVQLGAVALLVSALAGCSLFATTTSICRDYVSFEGDPAALAEAADLVFVGEVLGDDGVELFNEVDASAYTIRVDEVLKGDVSESELRVISIPDGCTTPGEPADYSRGNQLEVEGKAQFFLSMTGGKWTTFSPFEGATPLGPNDELYWDPAAPSPTPTP